jgi:endonuclease/exonuclease/phosphatase family metal-dependent hydrolase
LIIQSNVHYDEIASLDFYGGTDRRKAFEIEIGIYDRSTRTWQEKFWRETVLGKLSAVIAEIGNFRHHYLINIDLSGAMSLTMHTWDLKLMPPSDKNNSSFTDHENNLKIKVVTYNLWHTMPPLWSIPDERLRWARYSDRLDYFVQILASSDPDIVFLQEVRIDNSLNAKGSDQKAAGNQIHHLLTRIKKEMNIDMHFIFQPANNMFDKLTFRGFQLEEGVAILSKFPLDVFSVEVILLPRLLSESSDDHSRIVLRSLIKVGPPDHNDIKIDAFTSHFSLSSVSRLRAVEFLGENSKSNSGHIQIFGGDLNAEPHEEAIRLLESYSFRDAWKETHSNDANDNNGLTFPACRPVKRIDFIFLRNASTAASVVVVPQSSAVIGNASKEEQVAGRSIELAPEVGMLDQVSPLWASDHFGLEVVVDVRMRIERRTVNHEEL